MLDKKQNRKIESLAVAAKAGRGYDWRETPISSTPFAERSAPPHLRDSKWWEEDFEGKDLIGRSFRTSRNARLRSNGVRNSGRSFAFDASDEEAPRECFDDYLPDPHEDLYAWRADLRTFVEQTPQRRPMFARIDDFVFDHALGTRGRAVDLKELKQLVKKLCAAPGGLLIPREAAA